MRILVVANNDVGLYRFRRELIGQLLQKGKVKLSLPDGEWVRPLEKMGCRFSDTPVDRRGINPITDGKLFLRYWKLLRKEKPDLVITYTIKPNIYGGIACRLLKIPYAVNITGLGSAFQNEGMLRRLVSMLYKVALKKAKVVFFENASNMETLIKESIATEEQTCLLSGAGVNTEHYAYAPYPKETDVTRFLFIGRVMREKGIDELFSAMCRLHREGYTCALDVLGSYEEDYAKTMKAYSAEGWLNYHGYQKDVRPFIEKAHCFVLPSWHEGMANTNLESASMGRPLITSNIHGCKEAVLENVSGLLCEAKNTDSLYEAMVRFLRLSPEARETMGIAGRKHMIAQFDKKKVVEQTIRALGLGQE